MTRTEAFGLGWVLGCMAAATAALVGLIVHETWRADARKHTESRDVQLRQVRPTGHRGCRSLREA